MAGVAMVGYYLEEPSNTFPNSYLIKTSEVVNEGDLVGLNTSGLIVVANATTTIVKALGLAFFNGNNGPGGAQTGDGSTVYSTIARQGYVGPMTTALVPSLAAGLPVYLAAAPNGTHSNFTCVFPAVNGDAIQQVGYVDADGVTLIIDVDANSELKLQASGNSIVTAA